MLVFLLLIFKRFPFQADPNTKSRAGFTPLHLAAQEGHREISGLLIENGSDVGARANNGLTAMHLCAQEDRVPVAEELVSVTDLASSLSTCSTNMEPISTVRRTPATLLFTLPVTLDKSIWFVLHKTFVIVINIFSGPIPR